MKNRLTLLLLALLLTGAANAQPTPDSLRQILDKSLQLMEANSLHRKEINWKQFRQKVYARTKGVQHLDSLAQLYPLFFQWLNDYHGAVTLDGKWINWKEGRTILPPSGMLDSAFRKAPRLKVERWGDIGYFRVPAINSMDVEKWSQRLADSLCKVNPGQVKGWVIDLRMNTGGNVWPMFTALAPLIGEGTMGGIKFIDGTPDNILFIKDGKPFGNNKFYAVPNPKCVFTAAGVPVVVLTGPYTGSSGEALLLAFKGRPNTLILGEPSSGFVTSNNNWTLHPRVNLFLATGYMKDRKGNFYTDSIQPDVMVKGGDDFFTLEKDQKIAKAKEWLTTKPKAL